MNLAAAGPPVTAQPHYPVHLLQLNVTDVTGGPAAFEDVLLANNPEPEGAPGAPGTRLTT